MLQSKLSLFLRRRMISSPIRGLSSRVEVWPRSKAAPGLDGAIDTAGNTCSASYPLHINRLPLEILVEIFIRCLPVLADGLYSWQKTAPILLCHVCHLWRELVFSLPILWSFPYIPLYGCDGHVAQDMLQHWLERAGAHPLTLMLDDHSLPKLSAYIHRWGDVNLCLYNRPPKEFLAASSTDAQFLRHIKIRTGKEVDRRLDNLEVLSNFFNSLPNLQSLEWDVNSSSALLHFLWHRLTQVVVRDSISPQEFAKILSSFPSLEHAQFTCSASFGLADFSSSGFPTIQHHSLRSLKIYHNGNMGHLLKSLTLPSPISLKIHVNFAIWDYGELEQLILRSACNLAIFHWYDNSVTEETIITCLSWPCLRTVEDLDVRSNRSLTGRILNVLTYPNPDFPDGDVFPRLRRLALCSCAAEDGHFSDMVASRWGEVRSSSGHSSLEYVCANFTARKIREACDLFKQECLRSYPIEEERFRGFEAAGLDVAWHESWPRVSSYSGL